MPLLLLFVYYIVRIHDKFYLRLHVRVMNEVFSLLRNDFKSSIITNYHR